MTDATKKRERMCIGCGVKSEKHTLYRIVRTPDGDVRFDSTGRAAGRGAYVCSAICLEKARSKGTLRRALKCAVDNDQLAAIATDLAGTAFDAALR